MRETDHLIEDNLINVEASYLDDDGVNRALSAYSIDHTARASDTSSRLTILMEQPDAYVRDCYQIHPQTGNYVCQILASWGDLSWSQISVRRNYLSFLPPLSQKFS